MDNTGTSVTSLLVTEFGWCEENIGYTFPLLVLSDSDSVFLKKH